MIDFGVDLWSGKHWKRFPTWMSTHEPCVVGNKGNGSFSACQKSFLGCFHLKGMPSACEWEEYLATITVPWQSSALSILTFPVHWHQEWKLLDIRVACPTPLTTTGSHIQSLGIAISVAQQDFPGCSASQCLYYSVFSKHILYGWHPLALLLTTTIDKLLQPSLGLFSESWWSLANFYKMQTQRNFYPFLQRWSHEFCDNLVTKNCFFLLLFYL